MKTNYKQQYALVNSKGKIVDTSHYKFTLKVIKSKLDKLLIEEHKLIKLDERGKLIPDVQE